MPVNLFGFRFGRKPSETETKTFVKPANTDGALVLETGTAGSYQVVLDLHGTIKNETELVNKYREMSLDSTMDCAIDEVVNDMIIVDQEQPPVGIVIGENLKFSDQLKEKIEKEFKNVLNLLNFNRSAYNLCRRWYIDGKSYHQVLIDEKNPSAGIQELRYIDPRTIKKIRELVKKIDQKTGLDMIEEEREYYAYNKMGFFSTGSQSTIGAQRITLDSVIYCNSEIYDVENTMALSYLHKAIKPYNQLKCMEDALVIYRITRAPERRIFNIDVGDMPPAKAKQYIQQIMTDYKNKLVYNPATGEIRDDRRHSTILEDFWFPKRGDRTNEVTTLAGGQNLSEIADIEYFQRKLYKALNIPISRLDPENGFSLGKSAEITREEIKFSKFITRIRHQFSHIFNESLKRQLLLKNITTEDDWEMIKDNIYYDWLSDSYFAELKKTEILNNRLETLDKANQYVGTYFSENYVKREILMQSDKEIEEIYNQIHKKEEEKAAEKEPDKGTGEGDFPEEEQPEETPEDLPKEPETPEEPL